MRQIELLQYEDVAGLGVYSSLSIEDAYARNGGKFLRALAFAGFLASCGSPAHLPKTQTDLQENTRYALTYTCGFGQQVQAEIAVSDAIANPQNIHIEVTTGDRQALAGEVPDGSHVQVNGLCPNGRPADLGSVSKNPEDEDIVTFTSSGATVIGNETGTVQPQEQPSVSSATTQPTAVETTIIDGITYGPRKAQTLGEPFRADISCPGESDPRGVTLAITQTAEMEAADPTIFAVQQTVVADRRGLVERDTQTVGLGGQIGIEEGCAGDQVVALLEHERPADQKSVYIRIVEKPATGSQETPTPTSTAEEITYDEQGRELRTYNVFDFLINCGQGITEVHTVKVLQDVATGPQGPIDRIYRQKAGDKEPTSMDATRGLPFYIRACGSDRPVGKTDKNAFFPVKNSQITRFSREQLPSGQQ